MEFSSPSIRNHDKISPRYTGKGVDLSPPLQWSEVSAATKSLALICEDLDAISNVTKKKFVHWVVYNISPTISYIHEGIEKKVDVDLPPKICQGYNSFGEIGYNGPLPPDEKVHRYVFTLYALDIPTLATGGLELNKFRESIKGHILDSAEFTGRFENSYARRSKEALQF